MVLMQCVAVCCSMLQCVAVVHTKSKGGQSAFTLTVYCRVCCSTVVVCCSVCCTSPRARADKIPSLLQCL